MKIVDVRAQRFHTRVRSIRDETGLGRPGATRESTSTLVTVVTDDGAEGYAFGPNADAVPTLVKPLLVGEHPFHREKIWRRLSESQRGSQSRLSDGLLSIVDQALWDLAGRALNTPVYRLLGGYRTRVRAYGSTRIGDPDDVEGGLTSPQAYAEFALRCKARGYTALKIHTRVPPVPGTPSPQEDVAVCAAVREAVGPQMPLMLDPYHYYTRDEAYYIGREIEKLDFAWLEEPMDEHNTSSYIWLAQHLTIPVLGPEHVEGKLFTRAEWIRQGAADIVRAGTWDVGGITPVMKIAHLCEAFGVPLELHGPSIGNLHCLCAMPIPGEYFERGQLHPYWDYDQGYPWLKSLDDPMDDEGYVHVSDRPGLGQDIDWDYIRDHALSQDEPASRR
jgi:L-alanine-DL-glutamate epimerase-like enolase superfamily enzyme